MKKSVILLMILALVLSLFAACDSSTKEPDTKTATDVPKSAETAESAAQEPTGDNNLLEDGNTYKTGYPIVKEKITLHAIMESSAHCGDYNDMEYMHLLEELTNIHIDFEYYIDEAATKINLIFASRSFPDITFRGVKDELIVEAAKGGDVIALNDLIEEYAPNVQKVFADFPYAKQIATANDGNIYSLPYINDSTQEKGVRDLFLMNKVWLDELQLAVPETIDDFYNILKAFKDSAGTGSIPENVIPYHARYEEFSRSSLDIFPIFGVYVYNDTFLAANDDDEVMYQGINPNIKEPLKFLNKLYTEGLIIDEFFTDDTATYNSRVNSDPSIVGVYSSFTNGKMEEYIAIAPPSVPGSDGPYWRNQNNMVAKDYFTIYAVNENPEASIRLGDTIADPEWSLQGKYGLFGTALTQNNEGLYIQNEVDDINSTIPSNFIPLMLTRQVNDQVYWDPSVPRGNRLECINTVYKDYIAPLKWSYPPATLLDEETEVVSTYFTDIQTYREQMFSHWIVDGGIDEEWDDYVAEIKEMGLEGVLEAYQSAYDRFYGLD